jgi:hypothetical protein
MSSTSRSTLVRTAAVKSAIFATRLHSIPRRQTVEVVDRRGVECVDYMSEAEPAVSYGTSVHSAC